jgi:prevent-host-death family protein
MTTTTEIKDVAGQLAKLLERVRAGDVVLLTEENKPVAKLVAADEQEQPGAERLTFRSLKGHQVLAPVISQAEIAEEMFGPP